MNEPCPLPNRIPMPNTDLLKIMNKFGFVINNDHEPYVTYSMPQGWSLRNDSVRNNLRYNFVDENYMVRIRIIGKWNFFHNNYLIIYLLPYPYSYFEIQIKKCLKNFIDIWS